MKAEESRSALLTDVRLSWVLLAIALALPLGYVWLQNAQARWRVSYFDNVAFEGSPAPLRELDVRHQWRFVKGERRPVPARDFSARWWTCLRLERETQAHFTLSHRGTAQLKVGAELVLPMSRGRRQTRTRGKKVVLPAGTHLVEVKFAGDTAKGWIALDASLDGSLPKPLLGRHISLPRAEGLPCRP